MANNIKAHEKKFGKSHANKMRKFMKQGDSFSTAHKKALRKK